MSSPLFLKDKAKFIPLLFVCLIGAVLCLLYLYNGYHSRTQNLLADQVNKQRLISSIALMQVSQTLVGLDEQRSLSVFANEYSHIVKTYQSIKADLTRPDNKKYSQQVEQILSLLAAFNDVAKVRNDYSYRRNNLRVIVENGIDLNGNNEHLYLWHLLKSAAEAKNLLSLGELYRDFIRVYELIDGNKDAESKKIKNISFGALNVFSTMEKIISTNVILNQNLEEIIDLTEELIEEIVLDSSSIIEYKSSEYDRFYYLFSILIIFLISLYLMFHLVITLTRNRSVFSSLSEVADIRGIDKNGSINSELNKKDLLFYSKLIPYIISENNPSYILIDKDDFPVYFSKLFYEQNKVSLKRLQTESGTSRFHHSIQDNHYFISIAHRQQNQVLIADSIQHVIDAQITNSQKIGSSEYKLIFIKSETDEQDKQSERLDSLARITGAVAHDINNMISVIVSSLSILRESKSLNQLEDGKVIDRALFSADKSISLIDRLLTFSRCKKMNPELIDINELLEGLYEVIGFATDERVNIELALTQRPIYTYIDAGQLEASIINLCINASNAITKEGFIKISTTLDSADRVTILVEDNGHGIPKNIQGRVFEPFFTGRKKGEGHGLGLSMVYGFVKQSGGSISLDSQVGQGTKIAISFSLKKI